MALRFRVNGSSGTFTSRGGAFGGWNPPSSSSAGSPFPCRAPFAEEATDPERRRKGRSFSRYHKAWLHTVFCDIFCGVWSWMALGMPRGVDKEIYSLGEEGGSRRVTLQLTTLRAVEAFLRKLRAYADCEGTSQRLPGGRSALGLLLEGVVPSDSGGGVGDGESVKIFNVLQGLAATMEEEDNE